DSFALAAGLLADIVRNPAFAPDEIGRQRQQVLSALRVSHDNPEYVANVVFDRLVYGFHAYGQPGNGTRDSVELITRDDLLAFHSQYFAPNNTLLAVVGDVTTAEAMTTVTGAFGDWPRREIPAVSESEAPPPTRRVIVLDKPDAVQTEVRVGHLGIRRNSPDFLALDLAVRILGGEGVNRLHQVLRTERGLTYGASADLETLSRSGQVVAETNTRSDATAEVLRVVADEFSRLRRERVSERELADAKAYLSGNLPLTLETPDQIATQILNVLFYDLPLDELQTLRQRVNAITVDDISRVARQHLKPDQLSVVLVGDVQAFARDLGGVGFGRFERVPVADLDLTASDFRKRPAIGGRLSETLLMKPRRRR
ncbi:MAG: insulinase family protein, partial [Acidobacteria bacterium]|nr:insulinase family protein [Acidobacteriota bacterium]